MNSAFHGIGICSSSSANLYRDAKFFRVVKKPVASLLVFLIIASLVLPTLTYAQESADVPSESVSEPSAEAPAPEEPSSISPGLVEDLEETVSELPAEETPVPTETAPEESLSEEAVEEELPDEDPPQLLSDDELAISHPQRSVKSLLRTDEVTGALTYSYPIQVPVGRNGLQPDLKLVYNSQSNEQGSEFGSGWTTNIPYIQRINRTGSGKLYLSDYFTSSFSGELASTSPGVYAPKVESGDFLVYTYSTTSNVWVVKDKMGVTYTFGTTSSARQDNPNDSTKVYKWMLEDVRDANDNFIKYEYSKDSGEIYPSKIKYTGTGITDGLFEVEFFKETRPDIIKSNAMAFTATTTYRVNEIQAKVNGAWTRKYALSYISADNGTSSQLYSIVETGREESGVGSESLPASIFNYQVHNFGWATSTSWEVPTSNLAFTYQAVASTDTGIDYGVRMADVNGDGWQDFIRSEDEANIGTGIKRVYVSTTTNWYWDTSWNIPTFFTAGRCDYGTRLADVNGDGLADFLRGAVLAGGTSTRAAWLGTGSGWASTTDWQVPNNMDFGYWSGNGSGCEDYGVRIADINGDGLADLIRSHKYSSEFGDTKQVYINNGAGGWEVDSGWTVPAYFTVDGREYGTRLADVNGDGLVDVIQALETGSGYLRGVYINTGSTWVLDTNWQIPNYILFNWFQPGSNDHGRDFGSRLEDVNGDGLVDIIRADDEAGFGTTPNRVYLNNGNGWTWDTDWQFPTWFMVTKKDNGVTFADVNGDGMADIVKSLSTSGGHVVGTWLNNGPRANLVSSLVQSEGGRTSVTYKASPQYLSATSSPLNPNLPLVLDTVYQISNHDGFSATSTETLKYEAGEYYFNTPHDKKLSGFNKITIIDAVGDVTSTFYHQGNETDSAKGEFSDHPSKIGRPYRIEQYDSSNNLYSKIINKWDRYNQAANRDFVKLVQKIEYSHDGGSTHKDKGELYLYSDTTGNLSEKVELGEVTGADDGTYSDTGTDKFTTQYTYATSSTSNLIGLPSRELVLNQSSTTVKDSYFYYDTLGNGTASKGNLTKVERWKSGGSYTSEQKAYNSYGLVASSTDPRGKVTTYTYDGYNLHVATSTNPLSQSTHFYYDYSLGKPKKTVDANSRVYQTTYDGLDRVTLEEIPDLTTPSTLVTKRALTYYASTTPQSVLETSYLNSGSTTARVTYFDGLGRKIQTRVQAEAANTYAISDIQYDANGRLKRASLPYFGTGTTTTSATTTEALYTQYSYDALDRVTTTANAIGTTTSTHSLWREKQKDPYNRTVHDYYKDAYGNLTNVVEYLDPVATTTYEYNFNKNLTKITDALANIRNFTYDGIGRRLTAEDLHASGDGTFGTWTYTYDDAGNLTQRVDPKSQTVNFTYDDINRQLTEDYTGQAGTEITYVYDSCTEGVGRMCTASTTDILTSYAYTAHGSPKTETRTIGNASYITQYGYDRQGNTASTTYPDGAQVLYAYNNAGLLESMIRKESADASFTNVVTSFDYAPTGQQTLIQYANGATTTNTYNANALYRLTNKLTRLPDFTKAQDLSYTYDLLGNISQIIDNSDTATKKTTGYSYDILSRLLTATTTGATTSPDYSYTYAYNALGNITSGPLGTYSYEGSSGGSYANPHAPTLIATSTGGISYSTSTIAHGTTTASTTTGYRTGPVTMTWTHTATGTDPVIILFGDIWQDVAGTGSITSATWKGDAFTKVGSNRTVGMATEIWYLIASSTGSGTVSVTVTGATDAIKLAASTFTGIASSSPVTATSSSNGSSGSPSISATTTLESSLIVSTLSRFGTTGATTNRTSLYKDHAVSTLGAASYHLATSTATYTDTYTGSASADWSMFSAVFKPATSASSGSSGVSLSYDNNGNLTSYGTTTHTWNYRNELTQTANGVSTSTYKYDHTGQRIKLVEGGIATLYPNKLYTTSTSTGATSTKSLFAKDLLVSTIDGTPTASIVFDYAATSIANGFNVGPATSTWTHTVTGSNPVIVLTADIWQDVAGSGTITSATWKGQSFTKATSTQTGTKYTELWYLVATSTGSGTMSVTVTGTTDAIKLGSQSFTGVHQSSPLDTYTTSRGSSGNPANSITTGYENALIVTTLHRHTTTAATTNRTSLYNNTSGSTLGAASYHLATTTQSYTDTYTGSASQNWSMISASFRPASSGTTTVRYLHADHLGSTNAVTSATGTLMQTLDYYPYGGSRIKTGQDVSSREYIGEVVDTSFPLSYLNARYMDNVRGQFLSQDPSFLRLGDSGFEQRYKRTLQQHLQNPQVINSYGYANSNPVLNKDPDGEILPILLGAWAITEVGLTAYDAYNTYNAVTNPNATSEEKAITTSLFIAGIYSPGGGLTIGAKNVSSIVTISKSKLDHIIERHTKDGARFKPGNASYFNKQEDITKLIKEASLGDLQKTKLSGGGDGYIVTKDLGRNIGVDRDTGNQTSIMTVITDNSGNVVTAHPGNPGKAY